MDRIVLQIGSKTRKPKHKAQNRLLGQSIFGVKQSITKVSIALRKSRIADDTDKYLTSSSELILNLLISSLFKEHLDRNLNWPLKIKMSKTKPTLIQTRNTQKASMWIMIFKKLQIQKVNISFDKTKAIPKSRINLLPLISCFKKPIFLSLLISCGTSLAHINEKNRTLI